MLHKIDAKYFGLRAMDNSWWEAEKRRMDEIYRSLTYPSGQLISANDVIDKLSLGSAAQQFLKAHEAERSAIERFAATFAGTDLADEMSRSVCKIDLEKAQQMVGGFANSQYVDSLAGVLDARRDYERLFRAADMDELAKLISGAAATSGIVAAMGASWKDPLEHLKTLHHPWLNAADALSSASAFVGIQAVGQLATLAFEDKASSSIRIALGDWRDPIGALPDVIVNPIARTAFYVDRGFDASLTDFPEEAFEESLEIAELCERSKNVVDLGNAEQDFVRLRDLEIAIRVFISARMMAAFGEKWMRRQLPVGMLDRWLEKRNLTLKGGPPEGVLIDYADFTDYIQIIERGDNWKLAFADVFRRKEDVRESFNRLFPLRVSTMHSRIITKSDRLLLYVESKRILGTLSR